MGTKMEEKENRDFTEELVAAQETTIHRNGEKKSHDHHRSDSYHSSHSKGLSDTHHRKHKRSHSKKRDKRGRYLWLNRVQAWLDKKMSRKSLVTVSIMILLMAIIFLMGFSEYIEAHYYEETMQNGSQNGQNQNATINGSGQTTNQNVVVPAYWEGMITEKAQTVKTLQMEGGRDSVSFVWASDTHIPDNHTARTNSLGVLMAAMLDNCNIPFAVLSGDIGTRASYATEESLTSMMEQIPKHLSPLWGTDRLLVALGNHDGCYGDANEYYKKQLSTEEMWEWYFREQTLDFRRVFSSDGSYFYVDNVPQKMRFIVLNSQYGGVYAVDENGWAVNDRFSISCYGQEQLEWLANEALNMPDGYGAVIVTHVPPQMVDSTDTQYYTVDCAQLCGVIDAYNNHDTFSGSYSAGVDGWSNSVINVDFTDAKGEIIAVFAGHVHCDSVDITTLTCPVITVISAGAPVNSGENPTREFGTDTETSFDVVTINRKTRTIYCTRVGAGEDRVVKY